MLDRDVVLAKLDIVERCLGRIEEVRGGRRPELHPVDVDDITALNLQRAIQAAIDLAAHVVASRSYGLPASTAEVFTLLERQGLLEPGLADRLRRMVGFRNIAVHEYRKIDPDIVAAILDRHLGDPHSPGSPDRRGARALLVGCAPQMRPYCRSPGSNDFPQDVRRAKNRRCGTETSLFSRRAPRCWTQAPVARRE
jgi:uncharacterized protein YutE (UPF0331/DUF86 family)